MSDIPSADLLEGLLADLDTESEQLAEAVTALGDAGWQTATPAAGWTVATTVAHLTWTDEVAVAAARSVADEAGRTAWDALVLAALDDPDGYVDRCAHEMASEPRADVLARWRDARRDLRSALAAFPPGQRLPWFGPPMSPASMATARFMETWAHGLDVHDAGAGVGGPGRPAPTDRIRPVAHLGVRTRDFAFVTHGVTPPAEAFRLELTAPSGAVWEWGSQDAAQSVRGSAYDFCLLVTQRTHRHDTDMVAVGPDAERWLDIAQAFAGPAGEGRGARDGG